MDRDHMPLGTCPLAYEDGLYSQFSQRSVGSHSTPANGYAGVTRFPNRFANAFVPPDQQDEKALLDELA